MEFHCLASILHRLQYQEGVACAKPSTKRNMLTIPTLAISMQAIQAHLQPF